MARLLNIKRTTAYQIIRRSTSNKGIVSLTREGRKAAAAKVDFEMVHARIEILNTQPIIL